MTYVKIIVRSFALLIATTIASWAQSPPHQHPATTVIDGAVNPNLIPDSVAYRLYLFTVSMRQSPTQVDQECQKAHLMRTGLSDADRQVFVGILSGFRTQYDALEAAYNALASANSTNANISTLLTQLDDLVQSTRNAINAQLSSQGAARLNAFVIAEKANMKVQE
jgi:hypothetical protein